MKYILDSHPNKDLQTPEFMHIRTSTHKLLTGEEMQLINCVCVHMHRQERERGREARRMGGRKRQKEIELLWTVHVWQAQPLEHRCFEGAQSESSRK